MWLDLLRIYEYTFISIYLMRLTKRGRIMKKKLIIPFIFVLLISVILLVSCDKSPDDGQTGVQKPSGTQIFSDSFSIDNDKLYVKVSNDTNTFSFIDKIETADGATYTLSSDINGTNVIRSKTVELIVGDNTYYIMVENDKDMALYTATIRRRPIYEVVFDVKGGTEVEKQYVEEDDFAIVPTTEKNGCAFERWDWDFATPITRNTTITAIWNAFAYNIIYDLNIPEDSVSQEVDNSMNPKTYTVDDTVYFSAPSRNGYYFTGWSISRIVKGTTGTITTTAQWSPITYEIIYDFNDEKSVSKAKNNDLNPRYYNIESEITFSEPTRVGYSFVSWNKSIKKGTTGTQTITANWDVIDFNINYVLNGWTNAAGNKRTYTIEDQRFALFDGISGESLFCGWYLDDEYTNCIETIDASTMKDYTVYAMLDCGATKGLNIENGVVKGYSGTSNEIVIPSFYKGYTVDRLVGSSFNNCAILTSVTIPDSVKSIGEGALSGCSSLENITVPFVGAKAGVTNSDTYQYPFGYIFGTDSYSGGVATKQDYYENNTSSTVSSTYYIPLSLKSVTVTAGNILYGAFYNCSGLTNITVSDSATNIGDYAFFDCSALTKVAIGNSVISIGKGAFLGCEMLTSFTIPNSLKSIGNSAFSGCWRLVEVHNKSSLTITAGSFNNGQVAFNAMNVYTDTEGESRLSMDENGYIVYTDEEDKILVAYAGTEIRLTVPSYITKINRYAFYSTDLESITIQDSVTSIGYMAFYDCSSLTSITIPASVKSIEHSVFVYCRGLACINFKGTQSQWNAIVKGANWDSNCGSYIVQCTDGNIEKTN